METGEDIVLILNELLNEEVLDNGLLERSVNRFTELCKSKTVSNDPMLDSKNSAIHPEIVLMDFELYTEEKQEQVRLLKLKKVIQQDFEYAANMRDIEKE